jgi:ABC-type transport system substrate-binding protein
VTSAAYSYDYFDGILVTVIPDAAVRLANLRAGKIDVLRLEKPQYASIKSDPEVNVFRTPGNHVSALRFNVTKGVFRAAARDRATLSLEGGARDHRGALLSRNLRASAGAL